MRAIPQRHPTVTEITVKIDRAGRVSIPKPLRDQLKLKAGDSLAIRKDGEQITMRAATAPGGLRRKGKFWVIKTGEPITTETTNRILEEIREEREKSFL